MFAAALIAACGDDAGGGGRDAGSDAGADIRSPRECGTGVACAPGAECGYSGIESGFDCTCADGGTYACDDWASGGRGGEEGPVILCDRSYCERGDYFATGRCSVEDGDCNYSVACDPGGFEPTIRGRCD